MFGIQAALATSIIFIHFLMPFSFISPQKQATHFSHKTATRQELVIEIIVASVSMDALKEALSVLMLCTPVFIFTSRSSALLGHPRCGLWIWVLLLALFNFIHFSEFMPIYFSLENGQKMKIFKVGHFPVIRKWPLEKTSSKVKTWSIIFLLTILFSAKWATAPSWCSSIQKFIITTKECMMCIW